MLMVSELISTFGSSVAFCHFAISSTSLYNIMHATKYDLKLVYELTLAVQVTRLEMKCDAAECGHSDWINLMNQSFAQSPYRRKAHYKSTGDLFADWTALGKFQVPLSIWVTIQSELKVNLNYCFYNLLRAAQQQNGSSNSKCEQPTNLFHHFT